MYGMVCMFVCDENVLVCITNYITHCLLRSSIYYIDQRDIILHK
jgi:hypothetical protein